ncbi:MAG: hypothetical protein HOJ57_41955 [Lentisphaerae bacterium]|nr:hypothetical protein [Lentisphaerota bacterium]MBT5612578.1 hypothetical protein [Lentisphaerota bacterium]MBT7059106.1 hypothetical protein [Lentisphaerota bacterium]
MTEFVAAALGGSVTVIAGGALAWLGRTWIAERLTQSIRHEYAKDLEAAKVALAEQSDVQHTRWTMKRDACLQAMRVLDGLWSNRAWVGLDSNGDPLGPDTLERQAAPDIAEVRECCNVLALTCDTGTPLQLFKACALTAANGATYVDLRNAFREELGFGEGIDFDRANAFVGHRPK